MMRPGIMQPLKGARSKPGVSDRVFDIGTSVERKCTDWAPRSVTTTVAVGQAMIRLAESGTSAPIIEMEDIHCLAP